MVLATLGTDTGGSVRIPAAACGLVGLKPTYAEIPIDGVVPLSKRMDHVGPLTASVMDAWHVYRALLGQGGHRTLTALPVKTMRIGVLRRYFCDTLDRDVRARFDESLDRLRRAGAHLEDVRIGHADCIAPVYTHISFGDAAAYHATTLATMPERYTPPVRLRLEAARTVLAEDYVRALAGKECLTREVDAILTEHDAILLPTLAIPAPPVGASAMDVDGTAQPIRPLMLKLTQLFNLTGHPAVSVPCGRTSEGLPVGLQIVGARSQTEALLRVALGVEALLFQ
jgi:aspartyl-tRNA(Asn)/glutamyl-tRNA(Gln) amidotransferase subunit A